MSRLGCVVALLACALIGNGHARDALSRVEPAVKFAESRHALVIGNGAYLQGPLKNPVNDARAMARILADSGFSVTLLEDATQVAMQRAIRGFGDRLAEGGVGLFYFAGHGIQTRGRNYLIPVNADIDREYEVEYVSVDLNMVLSAMDVAKNPLNIVILDACRNNPFARSFRVSRAGLAQIDAPTGTLIAFATAPGQIALDGTGQNGIYTKHLLNEMAAAGLPLEQMFKQVRNGVMRETENQQVPWESSSLRGEFSFRPGPAAGKPNAVAEAVAEALRRDREQQRVEMEKMIQDALDRQRKLFEQQGLARPPLPQPESAPPPGPVASIAPLGPSVMRTRLPQTGDRWTYRLVQPRRGNARTDQTYVVRVVATSGSGVLDQVSIDGGAPVEWAHSKGAYLVTQGAALFSPYLALFDHLGAPAEIAPIGLLDRITCSPPYQCSASARIVGRETLRVPAGSFETIKVVVEHSWTSGGIPLWNAFSEGAGGRTLTIWYAEDVKRAIKYSSRRSAGSHAPLEPTFDLELVSYELK